MGERTFLSYGVDGWEQHDTAEEARKAFDAEVQAARDDANSDGDWPLHADCIEWGEFVVHARALLVESSGGAEEDGTGAAFDLEIADLQLRRELDTLPHEVEERLVRDAEDLRAALAAANGTIDDLRFRLELQRGERAAADEALAIERQDRAAERTAWLEYVTAFDELDTLRIHVIDRLDFGEGPGKPEEALMERLRVAALVLEVDHLPADVGVPGGARV